jgi:hypothetical protein
MKKILSLLCALLLASCGGNDSQSPAQPQVMQGSQARMSGATGAAASDYYQMVQHIYVAYFGRPADPAGMEFFAQGFLNAQADTNLHATANMYNTNAQVKALIEVFSGSAESQALYPGDNSTFIDAVYANLLNRTPDAAGKAFWVDALNKNAMTRANAAVIIMSSALGDDATLIARKVQAAAMFTASADTDAERTAYSGLAANAIVRTMLSNITLSTDPNTFQATVSATLSSLVGPTAPSFATVRSIVVARCIGCHSAKPTIAGFNPAPAGIRFDTEEQIRAMAPSIYQAAGVNESMPFGNMTGMTAEERATIRAWFEAGAK